MTKPDFRTPRIFLDQPLGEDAEAALSREHQNYLVNVLRLEPGAAVLVFNGRDGEWISHLAIASKRDAKLTVARQTQAQPFAADLDYVFAPLKHARLDYMVQKAVEMGASKLSPVLTQHTQVTRVNLERMRANAVEAAEQCGVLSIPEITEPKPLRQWLHELAPGRVLIFCDEGSKNASSLQALAQAPRGPLSVLIGPEGGFSDEERKSLLAQPNVIRLSLGPRILRADTAAVAALALVQATLGGGR
jgi:16S rRNA (uracil1498-N3)-methyltransferase